jgi:glycosyltransferase involved in cell wall biosynthesis
MDIAVFHPGTQHSWQTALALQQLDRLAWYATSIYYQPDRFPYRLESLLPAGLGGRLRREFSRFSHPLLDPSKVRTSGIIEWMERIASRTGRRRLAARLDAWGNSRFSRNIAADLRSPEAFALWGYNGSSLGSFSIAREVGRHCILDRTIGDFSVFNAIMASVRQDYGEWFLPTEMAEPAANIARDHEEYQLANTIMVGSRFVADTIHQAMGDPAIDAKVRKLDYCYDEALFAGLPTPRPVDRSKPVRFLFLGLVNPRKGIHHVLEALERLPASGAELTVVGNLKIPKRVFARFADRITYIPTVARAEVPRIMSEHHVLVLPSYFEGAALVLYEALAAGCALIQSRNCSEIATPETGVLLDRIDTESVYSAMIQAVEDRDRLDGWRAAAQADAQNYTFARYRENIAALLDELAL